MKPSNHQSLRLILILSVTFALFFSALVKPQAQEQAKLPRPTTHLTDTAGVVEEQAKQQLENTLANLQQRSGINLVVATVQTTGGRDIFDFSRDLARAWDIGSHSSAGKSLLVVVSVGEKALSTQFSKQVQRDLPEGALAEMNERMRAPLNAGRVSDALLDGVNKLVGQLAAKLGFSNEGMDQSPTGQVLSNQPAAITEAAPTVRATDAPAAEAKPAQTPAKADGDSSTGTTPRKPERTNPSSRANAPRKNTAADDEAEADEVEVITSRPVAERVEKLKEFLATHPDSKSKARATELLIGARAALGDDKLRTGDRAAGIEQMTIAINDFPVDASDKLFSGVIAQIPLDLYMRGEQAEAFKAARLVEAKVAADPKRLLTLSGFYLAIERGDEAARIAEQAVKLAPDMADAHNALGLALHISLRLDLAAAEYKRALELDPKTRGARRGLADLDRALGKFDDALALYREQLTAEPNDKLARTGLVLTLFELGKIDDAKEELKSAIKDDPKNLTLLAGTAYWLVAHGESVLGLELAERAANAEPRYAWAQIALARALIAQKNPLPAERALRFAKRYGKFPTLEYELANTLASIGLYGEAAEVLADTFTIKEGLLQTQLAGRYPAQAASFIELLALERKAGIFQAAPADSDSNARMLKALLALTQATKSQGENVKVDEAGLVAAAREFAGAGDDDMRVYRQLFAASRLLQQGIAYPVAQELADAARNGVDAAIFVPAVTVAAQADELHDIRARAIAIGGTPDVPDAPRNVLANILRGRIEDLSGWALLNQDKASEAVEHLKRAVNVLPENTPSWRLAVRHLGAALQQNGNAEEALSYYIKGYNAGDNDPTRRGLIEQLYKKVNGSLDGLEGRIGPAPIAAVATPSPTVNPNQTTPQSTGGNDASPAAVPTPGPTPTPEPAATQPSRDTLPAPQPTLSPVTEATPSPQPTVSPNSSPEPTPTPETSPSPSPTPSPEATPAASPTPSATPTAEPAPTPAPEPGAAPQPTPTPSPSPSPTPSTETRPRRVKPPE